MGRDVCPWRGILKLNIYRFFPYLRLFRTKFLFFGIFVDWTHEYHWLTEDDNDNKDICDDIDNNL